MLYSKLSNNNNNNNNNNINNNKKKEIEIQEKIELANEIIEQGHFNPEVISKWFNPITEDLVGYKQAKEWLSWLIYDKFINNLKSNENQQINNLIKKIELHSNIIFPKFNYNKLRKPMLLTLDPVIVQHKPLIFYAAIALIQAIAASFLMLLGFQPNHLPNSKYTYWIYEPVNQDINSSPIFFVHGIGIGLAMYIKKIYDLQQCYPNRKIILLELSYISMTPITQVNSIEDTISALDDIIKLHNLSPCSFIGHSYGTIVCGWFLKYRSKYVKKLTLIDPVCFAVWNSDLTRNFMYSTSNSFIHQMCQFFVSRDLFIGNTIGRNFFWHKNLLLPKNINKPTTVYLSKYDFIIHAPDIFSYLKLHQNQNFKVAMIDELTHGAYLMSRTHSDAILKDI
ncbi:alpha/beta-hydrolase [Neoconidiobolus thromboides FSU 785]|nr:alpha/beta-hydrolase [Neoconidiobolus thromboides FSU 785]